MLQTVLDKINGLLSASFWLANFLPVAIVAFLHAVLVAAVFRQPFSLDTLFPIDVGEAAGNGMLVMMLLVALAYAVSPLVPLFHGLLDGSMLPGWLHDWMHRIRLREWKLARARLSARATRASDALKLEAEAKRRLRAARNKGHRKSIAKPETIREAEAAVKLAVGWRPFQRARHDALLEAAVAAAEAALGANTTDPKRAAQKAGGGTAPADQARRDENAAWARRLDAVHVKLETALSQFAAKHEYLSEAVARRQPNFDLRISEATRLGDARRRRERYSSQVYCADFGWLWPRLQMVIAAEEGVGSRLAETRAQLDFATILIVLIQTVPLLWLVLLAGTDGWEWLALLIAATWPLLSAGLYEVLVRAEMAFGQITATAIDLHRLDLLRRLHQPRPPTLDVERQLWKRLCEAAVPALRENLVYAAPVGAEE